MAAVLPDLSHITLADEEKVYIPSDDTFLLCDAIHAEKDNLLTTIRPEKVVELGCGSGCVITYISRLLLDHHYQSFSSMGIDINIDALKLTRNTFENNISKNQLQIDLVQSNLFSAFEHTPFMKNVDVLIFNPPYVPSESSEIGSCGIEASYAGGIDGREVIDRFLPYITRVLSDRGVCYLVLVKENKPKEIQQILLSQYRLHSEVIRRRKAFNEELLILKIFRAA